MREQIPPQVSEPPPHPEHCDEQLTVIAADPVPVLLKLSTAERVQMSVFVGEPSKEGAV